MKVVNSSQSCECGRHSFSIDISSIGQILTCPSCSRKYYVNGRKTSEGDFVVSLSRAG
jgi:hypothetical protein